MASILRRSNKLRAIGYMLIFCISLPLLDSLTRVLNTGGLHLAQIVWIRSVVCVLIFLPGIIARKDYRVPKPLWKTYGLRSGFFFMGIWSWISVLDRLPMPQIYALGFTAPILASIFSVIFLKEHFDRYKILSLLGGFIGALVIIRPGFSVMELVSLVPLFSATCWAIATVLSRVLATQQNPYFMTAFLSGSFVIFTSPATLASWTSPNLIEWGILLFQGGLIANGYASMVKALRLAEVSIVAPVEFSKLIFASIFSALFFSEWIDLWTVIGGLIIFVSAALITKKPPSEASIQT